MAQARYYSATAQPTILVSSITNASVVINVQQTVGFPSLTPYLLALDYNTPSEEVVLVTAAAGTSLTVTRAYDGTSATSHNVGAGVRHVSSAIDFTEAGVHIGSTTNVHGLGVGSAVVGTTDTQTLSNKTLASPIISGTVTGGASYVSPLTISTAIGNVPLISKGASGQTADLQEWQDNTGAVLAKVTSAGQFITTNVGLQLFAIKPSNTSMTSNTTPTNDPHLTVAIPAAGTYRFDMQLIVNVGDVNADIVVDFAFPAGTLHYFGNGIGANSVAGSTIASGEWVARQNQTVSPSGAVAYGVQNGNITGIQLMGVLVATGAGTFVLQWAQFSSSATPTTLMAGSNMLVSRTA